MRHGGVVLRALVVMWFSMAGFPLKVATAALTLQSSFSLTQGYTDNLFYEDQNTKSDIGTLFGPNFTLQYDNPDIVIGGTYSGRVALFIKNPDEGRYIQNANIILDLPFLSKQYKGLTVTIEETLTFTPQLDAFAYGGARNRQVGGGRQGLGRPIDQTSDPQGGGGTQGIFTPRTNVFLNFAGITLAYAWNPGLTPTLSYHNQYRRFSDDDFQDSLAHIVTFSLPYKFSQRTTFTSYYLYRQIDFIGNSQNTRSNKIVGHSPQLWNFL